MTEVREAPVTEPVVLQRIEELYAEAHDAMVRLAYLMTGSAGAAEDVVHDAFAAVYQRWSSIDNPAAYLRRAVVNRCLTWRTRRALERDRYSRMAQPERTGDPEVDEVWDALAHLSSDRRAVVVLRFYGDLTHDEIAKLLGCPAATVRTRLHRALADLRKEIEP